MNKFTLDTTFHTLPTLWIGDRGLTVKMSEEHAQKLVDWLNVALDAERDELVQQRDALLKACERIYNDTDWCPVCEQHEHSASCILALVRDEDKGRQSAKLV